MRDKATIHYAQCPTCLHNHPLGVGVSWCACNDCFLWFGDTPNESLSVESLNRLKELVQLDRDRRQARGGE